MRSRAAGSASTSYSKKSLRLNSSHSRMSCVCGHRVVPKSSSLATGNRLQSFPHDVVNRGLHFLNARNVIALHDDGEIGEGAALDLAAVVAEQRNRQHTALARLFERHDDVARSAAGR